MIALFDYMVVSAILLGLGMAGIVIKRDNVVVLLMCVEMILLAANINFLAFSHFLNDASGQIFVFFILTIAAAEAAIGLAILMVLLRNRHTIDVEKLNLLKG